MPTTMLASLCLGFGKEFHIGTVPTNVEQKCMSSVINKIHVVIYVSECVGFNVPLDT